LISLQRVVFLTNSQSQRSDYTSAQLFIGIKAKDKQLGGFPHPPGSFMSMVQPVMASQFRSDL